MIDVRRAHFQAVAARDVYIRLPDGDTEEGKCGQLLRCMYGTRDAASRWDDCYSEVLRDLGFNKGVAS